MSSWHVHVSYRSTTPCKRASICWCSWNSQKKQFAKPLVSCTRPSGTSSTPFQDHQKKLCPETCSTSANQGCPLDIHFENKPPCQLWMYHACTMDILFNMSMYLNAISGYQRSAHFLSCLNIKNLENMLQFLIPKIVPACHNLKFSVYSNYLKWSYLFLKCLNISGIPI